MDSKLLEQLQELIKNDPEAENKILELLEPEAPDLKGIANKIKYLTKSTGHYIKDLQGPMKVNSRAAVNIKLSEGRFPFQDIIRIVDFLGGSIVVKVGEVEVEFTPDDL